MLFQCSFVRVICVCIFVLLTITEVYCFFRPDLHTNTNMTLNIIPWREETSDVDQPRNTENEDSISRGNVIAYTNFANISFSISETIKFP